VVDIDRSSNQLSCFLLVLDLFIFPFLKFAFVNEKQQTMRFADIRRGNGSVYK
jgi:hypothetical protein